MRHGYAAAPWALISGVGIFSRVTKALFHSTGSFFVQKMPRDVALKYPKYFVSLRSVLFGYVFWEGYSVLFSS